MISANITIAQNKRFSNWHFGENASISFSTSPVSYMSGSALNSIEACSSISDINGNLLFYTDGVKVYNKNHIQMPNGFGLNGQQSTTQGALIVPYPEQPNLYYIFTMDAQAGTYTVGACGCLSYSIVDMSLSGGLGNVTIKNTFLFDTITEKMAAYYSTDTTLWLVTHEWNTNNYLSYSISPSGISSSPIISSVGKVHYGGPMMLNSAGQMKFSKDGKKLGNTIQIDKRIEVFDFNQQTGVVSNHVGFNISYPYAYGFDFSPNGNNMYVTAGTFVNSRLFQYDLSIWDSVAIKSTEKIIYYNNSGTFGQLQLGIDNKIYVSLLGESVLSKIDNPNTYGFGCNLSLGSIPLDGHCQYSLPNVIWGPPENTDIVNLDTLCKPIIPNIITPNNDFINDNFLIECNNRKFIPEELIIYNRWGTEVFNNTTKYNDIVNASDGTYFYIFTLYDQRFKGSLSILK